MEQIRFTVSVPGHGPQVARFSQPFEDGFLPEGYTARLTQGGREVCASFRALTRYKSGCARAGMLTFLQNADEGAAEYLLSAAPEAAGEQNEKGLTVSVKGNTFCICREGEAPISAALVSLSEPISLEGDMRMERVEESAHMRWIRCAFDKGMYAVAVDIRAYANGTVSVLALVQKHGERDGYCPEFGWEIEADAPIIADAAYQNKEYFFKDADYTVFAGARRVDFPLARNQLAGSVQITEKGILYLRAARGERVAMQPYSYRRAAFSVSRPGANRLDDTLRFPVRVRGNEEAHRKLLFEYEPLAKLPDNADIRAAVSSARQSALAICLKGDDLGNVTYLNAETQTAMNYGINRMNHMSDYFFYGLCGGDEAFLHVGLLWAENYHDLTVWWGGDHFGGTRYPRIMDGWNGARVDQVPYMGTSFMWRANEAVSFSHKGFAHFFTAYELTGDPWFLRALVAQARYALLEVRVEADCTRNIGVARDFALLYAWTGNDEYRAAAISLFESLKRFVNEDGIFSENGMRVDGREGFIQDDATGYRYGFGKPYILGYGVEGLCALRKAAGALPGLDDEIVKLARYLVKTADECGMVRYPHPKSGYTHFTLEVAQHLMRALEAVPDMDAADRALILGEIEAMLKLALMVNREMGYLGCAVTAWEVAQGLILPGEMNLYYDTPDQRDSARDLADGELGRVCMQSEQYMPLWEVLSLYMRLRDWRDLICEPKGQLLSLQKLIRREKAKGEANAYETPGVVLGDWIEKFPAFMAQLKKSIPYSLARRNNLSVPFETWKAKAQARVMEAYQFFPPASDDAPVLLAEEDRGSYTAQKILFNISAFSRVSAYILIPKGRGPFPGMLVLHDHGAKFDIGKEKMIRPFGVDERRAKSAQKWVDDCYEGSFIGDELAKRGYVCFCTDALNWGERSATQEYLYSLSYIGEHGNHSYILDANMQFLGASHAGWIAHEDLAAARFLAKLPYVDSGRIGTVGLSMGAYRAWQVASMSPHIRAGMSICWMCQGKWLVQNGVNNAGGNNNAMLHAGLYGALDIPDVASLACPKPMLLYAGLQDVLFPALSVRACYHILRDVYEEQGASENLVTEFWDVPHTYNRAMQQKSFLWLDSQLKPNEAMGESVK